MTEVFLDEQEVNGAHVGASESHVAPRSGGDPLLGLPEAGGCRHDGVDQGQIPLGERVGRDEFSMRVIASHGELILMLVHLFPFALGAATVPHWKGRNQVPLH